MFLIVEIFVSYNFYCSRKVFYSAGAANAVLERCQQLKPGDKVRGYTIEKVIAKYLYHKTL